MNIFSNLPYHKDLTDMKKTQKKHRKYAFNTHLVFFFVLLLIFICFAILFLTDSEEGSIPGAICGFALACAPVFAIIISPVLYIFEEDSLTIVYCLGFKERIVWKKIRSITKWGGWFVGNGRGMPVFEIAYPHEEKYPFFVNATIARNRKTTKLIKMYCNKNIG